MNVKEYILVPRHIYNNLIEKECVHGKNAEQIDVNKIDVNKIDKTEHSASKTIDENRQDTDKKKSVEIEPVIDDNIPKETNLKPVINVDKELHDIKLNQKGKKKRKKHKHIDTLYVRKHQKYNWVPY